VLGAIGLSVGAAMAAALPSTAVEADLLGQASADLQARTREIADKVTDRAVDLADGVTAAIKKEAQAQGLTAESLKQSTSDASRKVQNIVAQSTERLRSVT
jgi:dGTP triphosphohydrolase